MTEVTPRAALNTFYIRCKCDPPKYEYFEDKSNSQTPHSCTVTCPEATLNGHEVSELYHTAYGSTKKISTAEATQLAFDELAKTEAYRSSLPPSELWQVLKEAVTDVVSSDADLDPPLHELPTAMDPSCTI